jgi:hypothetical protein
MNEPTNDSNEIRKLQAKAGGMLPGVAGICMYMLLITIINVFAALQGKFGQDRGKFGMLALCTLLAAGIFGLLRLQRWGWSLVLAGCLTLFLGYMMYFRQTHAAPYAVQGLFSLMFFLYLVRPEVRDRLR